MIRSKYLIALLGVIACLLLSSSLAYSQVDVLTRRYNNYRTGANTSETTLTVANVSPSTFGKLFSHEVIGQIYAQPLIVTNQVVSSPGAVPGPKNLVIVATSQDAVYAFDADSATVKAPYWAVSLGNAIPVSTYLPWYNDMTPYIGIVATPVVDRTRNALYVVAKTVDPGSNIFHTRLHMLSLLNGHDIVAPVEIKASVPATSSDAVNGVVVFNSFYQMSRPALTLANNVLYICFGSHGDNPPYHGWVMAYDPQTLIQRAVYCDTTNSTGGQDNWGYGGIWQGGDGPAVDSAGNLYLTTGNGAFSHDTSGRETGNSTIKLTLTANGFQVLDFFTDSNSDYENDLDNDQGASGVLLIPNSHFVIQGGKTRTIYVLDTNDMGKFDATGDHAYQEINVPNPPVWWATNHLHNAAIYWVSPDLGPTIYTWRESDYLQRLQWSNNQLNPNPVSSSTFTAPFNCMPGGMLSLSSNGSAPGTGIVWANMPISQNANQAIVPGLLRAFDATNLSHELWNSQMKATDNSGNFAKFNPPVIANGKVYLATFSNELIVYGLLPVPVRHGASKN